MIEPERLPPIPPIYEGLGDPYAVDWDIDWDLMKDNPKLTADDLDFLAWVQNGYEQLVAQLKQGNGRPTQADEGLSR